MEDEGDEAAGEEFEVEDILRYRKTPDGSESFLVKWVGYPVEEATWEPLEHLNENCKELIAKARAVFSFKKGLVGQAPVQPAVGEAEAASGSEDAAEAAAAAAAAAERPADELPAADAGSSVAQELAGHDREAPAQQQPQVQAPAPEASIIIEEIEDDDEEEAPGSDAAGTVPAASSEAPAPEDPLKRRRDALSGAAAEPVAKRPKQAAAVLAPGAGSLPTGASAAAGSNSKAANGTSAATASVTNGAARHALAGSPAAAEEFVEEPPAPAPKKLVARELRCICGATEKLSPTADRSRLVVCRICSSAAHRACVAGACQGGKIPADYVCPPCRLERVDEFHVASGDGLLRHSFASSSSTFTLSFQSNVNQWRKQMWSLHLRSVSLREPELTGPSWPHRAQGKLNGRQCVVIDPPKHLHIRREQCYNLTPLLKSGVNNLELRFTPKPDRARDEPEESYCVGVVLTRPRSVQSIIARIRSRSTETVASGQQRVRRLISQVARKEKNEDECKVTGNFGRILKPLCPVSLCPIEEAAIGRHCNHVQVFDLPAYIAVNQRMRSLDKRWTCPVCSLALRPDDVVLDPFAQGILDTLRGDEDNVEAVVFNENCTWSTISAEKNKETKDDPEGDEGKPPAEMIDLSDSD
eukprot:TRINITY_DN8919_c0_g1_i1.p1 TRINITY_DN8919_c0_g1~~TRINITY_DN8919_c0_g1_i1.p1  ORF type:complete len:641 (-),score=171.61 TRINITY_DN8919_c0_g1_i1:132-2054(-)